MLAIDDEADSSALVSELGLALLEEIAALPFDDPQGGGTILGPEFGEWTPMGNRANFDDVDDYDVWVGNQPLQTEGRDAHPIAGYTRAVAIDYVTADDFNQTSGIATDYKRITVTVWRTNRRRAPSSRCGSRGAAMSISTASASRAPGGASRSDRSGGRTAAGCATRSAAAVVATGPSAR